MRMASPGGGCGRRPPCTLETRTTAVTSVARPRGRRRDNCRHCDRRSGAELTTVGETDVSLFQVEQDEFTDDLKYADLYLIADGREGSLLWACWHDHAQSEFDIRVNQRRAARRREKGDTERVRFRVDRHASWAEPQLSSTSRPTSSAEPGHRRSTSWPVDVSWTKSSGKRMIVQIADLGTVSYDLVTAKPDIVGFVRACERMRDDVWTEEDAAPTDESSPTHP